jgi:hypothetical protein
MLFRKIFMACYEHHRLYKYGVWTKCKLFYLTGGIIQSEQKVSAHLMITIQKVTSNVQSVPRQSSGIY